MMWYSFDIQRFGKMMLPPILRGAVMLAFMRVLLTPLVYVMELFSRLRSESLDKLGRSGLVATLIEILNQRFGLTGEIWLEDIPPKDVYLYYRQELQDAVPLSSSNAPVNLRYSDEGTYDPDFIVHIPDFLQSEGSEIKRIIEIYRPAGRSYIIQYYDYNG